jgi:hypothetical protein
VEIEGKPLCNYPPPSTTRWSFLQLNVDQQSLQRLLGNKSYGTPTRTPQQLGYHQQHPGLPRVQCPGQTPLKQSAHHLRQQLQALGTPGHP